MKIMSIPRNFGEFCNMHKPCNCPAAFKFKPESKYGWILNLTVKSILFSN